LRFRCGCWTVVVALLPVGITFTVAVTVPLRFVVMDGVVVALVLPVIVTIPLLIAVTFLWILPFTVTLLVIVYHVGYVVGTFVYVGLFLVFFFCDAITLLWLLLMPLRCVRFFPDIRCLHRYCSL